MYITWEGTPWKNQTWQSLISAFPLKCQYCFQLKWTNQPLSAEVKKLVHRKMHADRRTNGSTSSLTVSGQKANSEINETYAATNKSTQPHANWLTFNFLHCIKVLVLDATQRLVCISLQTATLTTHRLFHTVKWDLMSVSQCHIGPHVCFSVSYRTSCLFLSVI